MRRRAVRILGWLLAVVAATATGLTAVSLLSAGLTSDTTTPLSEEAVVKALSSATGEPTPHSHTPDSTPPSPSAPNSVAPSPDPTVVDRTRSESSTGGSMIVRCTGAKAYLVAWTPAQGFSVGKYERGPAKSTLVQFDGETEALDDIEVVMTATCRDGEPVTAAVITDD